MTELVGNDARPVDRTRRGHPQTNRATGQRHPVALACQVAHPLGHAATLQLEGYRLSIHFACSTAKLASCSVSGWPSSLPRCSINCCSSGVRCGFVPVGVVVGAPLRNTPPWDPWPSQATLVLRHQATPSTPTPDATGHAPGLTCFSNYDQSHVNCVHRLHDAEDGRVCVARAGKERDRHARAFALRMAAGRLRPAALTGSTESHRALEPHLRCLRAACAFGGGFSGGAERLLLAGRRAESDLTPGLGLSCGRGSGTKTEIAG